MRENDRCGNDRSRFHCTMILENVRSDSPNDTVSHLGIAESLNSNMADIHCQCYNILYSLQSSFLHGKQITFHVTLT